MKNVVLVMAVLQLFLVENAYAAPVDLSPLYKIIYGLLLIPVLGIVCLVVGWIKRSKYLKIVGLCLILVLPTAGIIGNLVNIFIKH